jgi:hypothetical protein
MITRLYNDNGCETPNGLAEIYSREVRNVLRPIIAEALKDNISLRDLQNIIFEETTLSCAEERLRKGIREYQDKQKAPTQTECGCQGCR